LLESGIVPESYTTSVTLTPGTTYGFKVTARNLVGDSELSEPVSILAAKPPDAPIDL
jgi:hypothetical protein